jgi:hypothetical protein
MPTSLFKDAKISRLVRWAIGIGLVIVGAVMTYAVQLQDWKLAQIASMTGIVFLVAGVAILAGSITWIPPQSESAFPVGGNEDGSTRQEKTRAQWLTRLVLVAVLGMVVIVLFAIQYHNWALSSVAAVASVALITAGAAWLTGALLGFLFGIPYINQGNGTRKKGTDSRFQSSAEGSSENESTDGYQPSTSLEQISDWLTKIIVGVGLTQINKIPGKLIGLAKYVGSGLGGGSTNESFALGITIYYSVCGFLFGYLWARLYLLEAFRDADLRKRYEKLTSEMINLQAKALVNSHLDPSKSEVPESVLKSAIEKASQSTKDEIYERAKESREDPSYSAASASRAAPVFRVLADLDKDNLDHKSRGQLGSVLLAVGLAKEAHDQLNKAIEIRDRVRHSGWKNYELNRARARIFLDASSKKSTVEVSDAILADLREAFSDPKHVDRIKNDNQIRQWLERNGSSVDALAGTESHESPVKDSSSEGKTVA